MFSEHHSKILLHLVTMKVLIASLVISSTYGRGNNVYATLTITSPNEGQSRSTPSACESKSHPGIKGTCVPSLECQQKEGQVIGVCSYGHIFGACCYVDLALEKEKTKIIEKNDMITKDVETTESSKTTMPVTKTTSPPPSTINYMQPSMLSQLAVLAKIKIDSQPAVAHNENKPNTASQLALRADESSNKDSQEDTKLLKSSVSTTEATSSVGTSENANSVASSAVTTSLKVQIQEGSQLISEADTSITERVDVVTSATVVSQKTTLSNNANDSVKNSFARHSTAGISSTSIPNPSTTEITIESNQEEQKYQDLQSSSSSSSSEEDSEKNQGIFAHFKLVSDSFDDETTEKSSKTSTSTTSTKATTATTANPRMENIDVEGEEDSEENWDNNINDFVNQVVHKMAEGIEKVGLEDKDLLASSRRIEADKQEKLELRHKHSSKHKKNKIKIQPVKKITTEEKKTGQSSKKFLDYRRDCGVRPIIKEKRRGKIVGGQPSEVGAWPWYAIVKESYWFGLFSKVKCGGVLISPRHVLTAAHCQPKTAGSLSIVLGMRDAEDKSGLSITKSVRRVIRHPYFNARSYENDVAVLELDSPVKFQPHIVPICLPHQDENFEGDTGYATGMGLLRHDGDRSVVVQEVDVPILNNTVCQSMYLSTGSMKPIKRSYLCAGGQPGKDSCGGDSGGPLSVRRRNGQWVLAGIVSHGLKCAMANQPGIYMKTSYYKKWILKVAKMANGSSKSRNKMCRYGPCLRRDINDLRSDQSPKQFSSTFWRLVSFAGNILLAIAEK